MTSRLAVCVQWHANALRPLLHQTGTLTALQGPVRCRKSLLHPLMNMQRRNLLSKSQTADGSGANPNKDQDAYTHLRRSRGGLMLSRRRSKSSSKRRDMSFGRISETRLRNWLKAYNAFHDGRSHLRLRVFAQNQNRRHPQRQEREAAADRGGDYDRNASSSTTSTHSNFPRFVISGDERRIFGQIANVLEDAMSRAKSQRKRDIARKQKELIALQYEELKREAERLKKTPQNTLRGNKAGRSIQDRTRLVEKELAALSEQKPARQLTQSSQIAVESRTILSLFQKAAARPGFKIVRDKATGKRRRVPRLSDGRVKSILASMKSSRPAEGSLKDAFNDSDVRSLWGSTDVYEWIAY